MLLDRRLSPSTTTPDATSCLSPSSTPQSLVMASLKMAIVEQRRVESNEEATRCQRPSPMPLPNPLPGLDNDGHALRQSAKLTVVVGAHAASSLLRITGVKKVSPSSSTGDIAYLCSSFTAMLLLQMSPPARSACGIYHQNNTSSVSKFKTHSS